MHAEKQITEIQNGFFFLSSISIINVIIEGRDENKILRIKAIVFEDSDIDIGTYRMPFALHDEIRSKIVRTISQEDYGFQFGIFVLVFLLRIPIDGWLRTAME